MQILIATDKSGNQATKTYDRMLWNICRFTYLLRRPFSGQISGGANLRATFRNVKRKTKGLPYNVSKIGNMCRKSGIQKNPFEISSIISSN
jgi:hypothetical protein